MKRAVDGHSYFSTPDGLDIWVTIGIVFGDGSPRVEIASISDPSDLIPVEAIDRASKCFLFEVHRQLRKRAYRNRSIIADPKSSAKIKRGRTRVVQP